ncbi:hypothetical protein AB0F81_38250 [Actinoplanes sp. NPDC024001]|uniref:hypothetical protein n=1 Tax=Actinoplanes sp. NPDC024001 TaxID=3154598 RepID=UPI0033E20806
MTERPFGRPWVGAALAAVPHVILLAWMALLVAQSSGTDRVYASLIGLMELYVVPFALVAALITRFVPAVRGWAWPIAGTTVAGALLVFCVAMIVAQEGTWA